MKHRRRNRSKFKVSKAKGQVVHAKKRFFQRFGVMLNTEEYNHAVHMIQKNKAEFVAKQSNRVSVFKVVIQGIEALAIYDRHRKTIATFLPVDFSIGNKLRKVV